MHRRLELPPKPVLLCTVSALAPLCGGCAPPAALDSQVEASATPQGPAAPTPAELLEPLQTTLQEVEHTAKFYAAAGGAFRLKHLRESVDLGVETADRLMAHGDAGPAANEPGCQGQGRASLSRRRVWLGRLPATAEGLPRPTPPRPSRKRRVGAGECDVARGRMGRQPAGRVRSGDG